MPCASHQQPGQVGHESGEQSAPLPTFHPGPRAHEAQGQQAGDDHHAQVEPGHAVQGQRVHGGRDAQHRERVEDIPLLISYFLNHFNEKNHKNIKGLSTQCHSILMKYPWHGNVRELKNVIERAVILSAVDKIDINVLPERILTYKFEKPTIMIPLGTTVDEAEKQLIFRTLKMENNNKTRAAQTLGISLKTLHNKLGKYRKDED